MPARRPKKRTAALASSAPPDLLNDRAYAAIRDAIASFRLAPGQSVSVGSLAEWLRMSRTPVRDALQRLQHEGMIRSLPRRGLIVAPLTPGQAEEVYELQEALEGMAARLAALRATPEQRRELVAIARRLGPAARDPDEWVKVDTAYHELVMAAAQSRAVERASAALGAQLLRFRALAALNRPDRPARSAKEHLRIAHAIAKGNADVALRLTHAHWAAVRDEAVENLQIYARMTGVIGSDRRLALSPARAAGDPLPR